MYGYRKLKWSFSHTLGSLPQVSPEREKELITKLRNQSITEAERNELASGLVKFAISIAACYRGNIDELVAEALFGLARGLDYAPQKLVNDNLLAYLAKWIHKYCVMVAGSRKGLVGPSQDTIRKHLKEGKAIHVPEIVYDVTEVIAENDCADKLLDCILASAETDFEKQLVKLKLEGLSDIDVARTVGCNPMWVCRVKRRLYERYLQLKENVE